MKFLQIKNTENGEPSVLESFKDFDLISDNALIVCLSKYDGGRSFYENKEVYFKRICLLDDCYKSRPLIEIDGYCEFDILNYSISAEIPIIHLIKAKTIFSHIRSKYSFENLGSIFLPENKEKYPELYQEALRIINNN
jgi:hypothetical protein